MQLKKEEVATRQQKYRHLDTVCHLALKNCGILNADLKFISDTANIIFYAKAGDQAYCVRICQQGWQIPEIKGELFWLLDLNQNTELILPKPIPTPSGELVQEIISPDSDEPLQIVLFHWIDGEIIGNKGNKKWVRHVGRIMGHLHNHAATFELPSNYDRDRTDWLGMGELMANMKMDQISRIKTFLTQSQITLCNEAAQQAASVISKIDDQDNFGLIHSDLHLNNCVLTDGRIGILDFDDCQFAPFTCDLAITMSSFDESANTDALEGAFLQGYSEKRELPPNYLTEIEAFRIERRLRLIRWASTWPSINHFSFGREVVDTSLKQCQDYIFAC